MGCGGKICWQTLAVGKSELTRGRRFGICSKTGKFHLLLCSSRAPYVCVRVVRLNETVRNATCVRPENNNSSGWGLLVSRAQLRR